MVRRPARHDNANFTFAARPNGVKQNDRMKDWRQTIDVICSVVLTVAALGTFMQFALAGIRAEMNAQFSDVNAERAAICEQLNSVDRRTSRIEGRLFGIEIPQDSADGE